MKSLSIKFKIIVILVNLTANTIYSHSYDQMNQRIVKVFSSAINTYFIKEFFMKNGIKCLILSYQMTMHGGLVQKLFKIFKSYILDATTIYSLDDSAKTTRMNLTKSTIVFMNNLSSIDSSMIDTFQISSSSYVRFRHIIFIQNIYLYERKEFHWRNQIEI